MKLYYIKGITGDKELVEAHKNQLLKICQGDYSSGNLERLVGHNNIYSFRTNHKARLLFTIEVINKMRAIVVLDYLPTHDYQKSSFLRSGVLARYQERNQANQAKEFLFVTTDKIEELSGEAKSIEHAGVLEYYNETWIQLTNEQNEVHHLFLPALVSGVAGSGKSAVTLSLISAMSEECRTEEDESNPKPLLYLAKSEFLVKKMSDSFLALPLSPERLPVVFKSMNALLLEQGVGTEQLVDCEYFFEWYRTKKNLEHKRAKAQAKPLEAGLSGQHVYNEFLVAGAYTQAEYKELGDIDCSIAKDSRDYLYDLYTCYLKYLADTGKVDPAFYHFPDALAGHYKAVFSDESQDYSSKQLKEITRLAHNKQLLFCVDSHQNLNGVRSTRHYLLKNHVLPKNHLMLNQSFRSAYKIVAAANLLVALKQRLHGGLADQHEAKALTPGDEQGQGLGAVHVMEADMLKNHTWLQTQSTQPHFAIVTTAEKKDEVKALFPECILVMTPEEIKGLEYPLVVSYGIGDAALYKDMRNKLASLGDKPQPQNEPKAGARDERFSFPLNQLYVSWTRAQQVLIVCEPAARADDLLLTQIKNLTGGKRLLSEEPLNATHTNWEEQLDLHIKANNDALAELIWSQKLKRIPKEFSDYVSRIRQMLHPVSPERCPGETIKSKPQEGVAVSVCSTTTKKTQSKQKQTLEPQKEEEAKPDVITVFIDSLINDFNVEKLSFTLSFLQKNSPGYEQSNTAKELMRCIEQRNDVQRVFFNYYTTTTETPHQEFWRELKKTPLQEKMEQLEQVKKQCQLVLKTNPELPSTSSSLVQVASYSKNEGALRFLHSLGSDMNQATTNGATPAYIAAQKGYIKVLRVLKELGADLNKATNDGETPAHIAAQKGDVNVLRELKKLGADLNKASNDGATPAYIAAQNGNATLLCALKDMGADLNKAKDHGETPAHIAAVLGHVNVLCELKKLGVDLNQVVNGGDTLAYVAAHYARDNVLRLLKELGADLNQATKSGYTPAYAAARNGDDNVLRLLKKLEADLDLNKATNDGETPAYIAAENGNATLLCALRDMGADLNQAKSNGETPAYIAAENSHIKALRKLKKMGADLNKARNDGETPAYVAALYGNVDVLDVLKELGADLNQAANDGTTPLFIATLHGHTPIVNYLINSKVSINTKIEQESSYLLKFCLDNSDAMDRMREHCVRQKSTGNNELVTLTLLEAAKIMGHKEMVKLLSSQAATTTHTPQTFFASSPESKEVTVTKSTELTI